MLLQSIRQQRPVPQERQQVLGATESITGAEYPNGISKHRCDALDHKSHNFNQRFPNPSYSLLLRSGCSHINGRLSYGLQTWLMIGRWT